MHPLLARQLKHLAIDGNALPPELSQLLTVVDSAYQEADEDRRLVERSMELTSRELLDRNRELTTRNKELAALREAGLDCIITMDHHGRIREFNPAAEKTFGLSRDRVIGQSLAQLIIPERLRDAHEAGLARYLSTASGPALGKRIEVPAMRADGSEFPVEMAISVVRLQSEPLFVAYLRDITDRKQAEAAGRAAEKLALVASRTDNAVILTDPQGQIEWVNDGFTRISGFSSEEVVGKKPGSILQGPQTDPRTVAFMRDRLSRGEGFKTEIVNYSKAGTAYWLAIEVQPIRDSEGRLSHFMAIESDISERKRVERELHAAKEEAEAGSKAKSEFLANTSHEIRTPLNGVIGMTELLLATDLTTQQRRYSQIAKSSADALLVVLNQILDFSKIEAGKLELESIDFELRSVVEQVVEMLAHRAASKGLELACRIDGAVPTLLRGDPSRLRQVLINLVSNAVKFTEKGEIIVHVTADAASSDRAIIRFAVMDTGVGIPSDRRDRLFRAFSQVDTSTTRKYGGTGLGLIICKQIAELMGGRIGVESEENLGSTFWFTADLAVRTGTRAADQTHHLAGVRVLVVDDNASFRTIMQEQLIAWGMKPTTVDSPADALIQLRQGVTEGQPFRIIMVDHNLRGASGLELARSVRADPALRDTPMILITSLDTLVSTEEAQAAGLCQMVNKPIRQSQLFDATIDAFNSRRPSAVDPSPVARAAAPPVARKNVRVLLAEDNEINQIVASEILTRAGFSCDIASTGKRALTAVQSAEYDLVLMDCQMPEMDGFQATAAIRQYESEQSANGQANRHVPIIALTANALKGDRENCLAAGMDEYLCKPLDPRQLIATMERLLAGSQSDVPTKTPKLDDDVNQADPFDLNALLARCMGDLEFRNRLLARFPEQAGMAVAKIETALQTRDGHQVSRAAHGLKGTAANLSAPAVQRIAGEIEALGAAGSVAAAEEKIAALRAEVDRCIQSIPAAVAMATAGQ